MSLGQNIAQARKIRNISQEDMAAHLNVSRQSVSLWENDQTIPTLDKLKEIANYLNTTIDQLSNEDYFQSTQPVNNNMVKEKDNSSLFLIDLCLTILGVILWMIPILGVFVNVLSVIFSFIDIRNQKGKFLPIALLIISLVFLVASLLCTILY